MQRFLDAAFELMDEKGSTDFTIQEVIDRSKQSLRGFYQYFDGKDELLLALFEETVRESIDDLRAVIESETGPSSACAPSSSASTSGAIPPTPRASGARTTGARSRSSRCSSPATTPIGVKAALAPISQLLVELLDDANEAGDIEVTDRRRTGALVMRTVMYSWFGNRLAQNARMRITPEDTWEFCLQGLHGRTTS